MSDEKKMIAAHRLGLQRGSEIFAELARDAMGAFPDPEEQLSFMAGAVAQLRRITQKHGAKA